MSKSSEDLGTFFAGLIIGGLVGAATTLLLAPQSGEETRTLIKEKSIELKDKAAVTADEAKIRAGELAEKSKMKASELQQRGQVVLEEQKTKLGRGSGQTVVEQETIEIAESVLDEDSEEESIE
jgi:gas vesicle protein